MIGLAESPSSTWLAGTRPSARPRAIGCSRTASACRLARAQGPRLAPPAGLPGDRGGARGASRARRGDVPRLPVPALHDGGRLDDAEALRATLHAVDGVEPTRSSPASTTRTCSPPTRPTAARRAAPRHADARAEPHGDERRSRPLHGAVCAVRRLATGAASRSAASSRSRATTRRSRTSRPSSTVVQSRPARSRRWRRSLTG